MCGRPPQPPSASTRCGVRRTHPRGDDQPLVGDDGSTALAAGGACGWCTCVCQRRGGRSGGAGGGTELLPRERTAGRAAHDKKAVEKGKLSTWPTHSASLIFPSPRHDPAWPHTRRRRAVNGHTCRACGQWAVAWGEVHAPLAGELPDHGVGQVSSSLSLFATWKVREGHGQGTTRGRDPRVVQPSTARRASPGTVARPQAPHCPPLGTYKMPTLSWKVWPLCHPVRRGGGCQRGPPAFSAGRWIATAAGRMPSDLYLPAGCDALGRKTLPSEEERVGAGCAARAGW